MNILCKLGLHNYWGGYVQHTVYENGSYEIRNTCVRCGFVRIKTNKTNEMKK